MNCASVSKLLPSFQDHELTLDESMEVEKHLSACSRCQEEEKDLRKTWELLQEFKSMEPSSDFRARFWERVRKEEESVAPAWWSFQWRPGLALASMVAVALVAGLVTSNILLQIRSEKKKSPLLQWAQSDTPHLKVGGLSL